MVIVGTVVGNYRIVSQIGAGGMGMVWLGEHKLLGSRAAIKVLLPAMSVQQTMVDRFFDEARAATRIQDPGIVTVIDFGWHEGAAYIVMEHLRGESLAARLGMGKVPPVQALRVIQQCAIAMAAAHARGIIHRDLKPDNVFLVADQAVPGGERIKILDFGIAKLLDDGTDPNHQRTVTGVIMGTPAFMSPEQCRGAGGTDHRTDIYALGCVLFNLLCGRPPFIAPTPGDMIVCHIEHAPPAPSSLVPGLPPAVDALVLKCLAKSPGARFATMTELARAAAEVTGENKSIATMPPLHASSAAAGPQTVETNMPSPQMTTLRASTGEANGPGTLPRSRPPWPILLASIAVAGVIAIAVAVVQSSRSSPATSPTARPLSSPAPIDAAPQDAMTIDAPVDAAAGSALKKKPRTPSTRGSDVAPAGPPDDPLSTR